MLALERRQRSSVAPLWAIPAEVLTHTVCWVCASPVGNMLDRQEPFPEEAGAVAAPLPSTTML